MKTARTVLNHLFLPFKDKIIYHKCIQLLKEKLPKEWLPLIQFIKLRQKKLIVGVTHPALLHELNLNRRTVLKKVEEIYQSSPRCLKYFPRPVGVVVELVPPKPVEEEFQPPPPPVYPYRAKGEFEIPVKDPELREIFMRIRNTLRKKWEEGNGKG